MKLRHLLIAAALGGDRQPWRWAQGFSDTSMGVRDGPWISNPAARRRKGSRDVNKIIVNVGHFDVWDYGSNFFNVDILFSNANEPANNSAGGSTEFYARLSRPVQPGQDFRPQHQIRTDLGDQLRIRRRRRGREYPVRAGQEAARGRPELPRRPGGRLPECRRPCLAGMEQQRVSNCANACIVPGGPVSFNPTPEFEFVWLYA